MGPSPQKEGWAARLALGAAGMLSGVSTVLAPDESGIADMDPLPPERVRPAAARLGTALGLVVVAAFVVLRFWTRSDLWLDEAQTLDIARLPLARIPAALRMDGSPPLYYFLLHLWMAFFGTSNLAVRSLSGFFGVLCLPLSWLAGRQLGGRRAGWVLMMLVASSPWAVRYSTENRMYMMVVALSLAGFLALRAALDRPSPTRLLAVQAVTGLLVYSQYWAFYLVAAVIVALAWAGLRAQVPARRASARWSLAAVVGGGLLFLPWLPSFLFQLAHTGTPWAPAAYLADLGSVPGDLAGLGSPVAVTLGLVYVALLVLGLFGSPAGRLGVFLDLRVRPVARPLAWVAGATLVLALSAGQIAHSAYQARYLAVIMIPVLALVSLGLLCLADARVRVGVLSAVVGLGLVGSLPNVATNRTQAGEVAAALASKARPGDVVAYCPDQLGPAVNRLLPPGRYRQVAYPRGNGPAIVDWIDYDTVSRVFDPAAAARALVDAAGPQHRIWLVWSGAYPPLQHRCPQLLADLVALRPHFKVLFTDNSVAFYEHEELVEVRPGG